MGEKKSMPSMKIAGRRPAWNKERENSPMMPEGGMPADGLEAEPMTPLLAMLPEFVGREEKGRE